MALTLSLSSLRDEVVLGAGIDGQTSASSRHPTTTLNSLINRYWQALRSLVSQSGEPWFQVIDTATTIPAQLAGEDHIEIPYPTLAQEILGVDVFTNSAWRSLDPSNWNQRRLLNDRSAYPAGGAGWFAIKTMPEARSSTSVTAGTIALFPGSLSGQYRVSYLEQWTPITTDTHLFVGQADWFQWVILNCVIALSRRDANKKGILQSTLVELQMCEDRIVKASKRQNRAGAIAPMRRGGEIF